MDLVWSKILVAILFGILRLIFGLLPIKLYSYLKIWKRGADGINHIDKEKQEHVERCLTLHQSFGGGVLFATCFLHMMPEVYHEVRELEEHYNAMKIYPISQLIICLGFFLIYFLEEISQYLISRVGVGPNSEPVFIKSATPSLNVNSSATNKISPCIIEEKTAFEEKCCENTEKQSIGDSVDSGLDKSNEDLNVPMPNSERALILELENCPQRMFRACLITMALSFHAIFEGIAIGLQSSVSNIWYLFVAISIHSVTLLFVVGVQLLSSYKRPLQIFYFILVLALTSPAGILIGLAVSLQTGEESMGTAIASALLEGLSAGTMLYITFFEVLFREKESREFRFKRGICIIAGFVVMALLQTWQ